MGNPNTRALALNLEGLIKLLGKTSDDRLRYWEIVKGITSIAEFELATQHIDAMANMAQQLTVNAKALQKTAGNFAKPSTPSTPSTTKKKR
jgi:hypothetical protein